MIREALNRSGLVLKRETPDPTEAMIYPQIQQFWAETYGTSALFFSPRMNERIWAANRCIQLNAQQIASMPLRFETTAPAGGYEPAWLTNPDPAWFPNGIADALLAAVAAMYGWGYTLLIVTSRYEGSGYPRSWTVAPPEASSVELRAGRRVYRVNGKEIPPGDVVQIDRNPGSGLHGTSALRAYAPQAWTVAASGELAYSTMTGGVPTSVLKSGRPLTETQARALQSEWVTATARRGGAPAVLPPGLEFETLQFSPKDLLLLDLQQYSARVVASAFGVPAFMLNLPMEGSLIYQNPQMLGEFWWRFELRPTAKRLADALTTMLPRGNSVSFDASDTFAPITEQNDDDDASGGPQKPAGEVRPIRPVEVTA